MRQKHLLSLKLFLIALVWLVAGCDKNVPPDDLPPCISAMVDEIQNSKVRNPPAQLWKYEYNGRVVYYFPAYCCDIPSMVYDENCNAICSPDGGITGRGDGRCSDFFCNRTSGVLLWYDKR